MKEEITMRIEDNYRDVVVYNVMFKSKKNRMISKVIILNAAEEKITETIIKKLVMETFNNILEIIKIEGVVDGLLLRETSDYYIEEYTWKG